jgi:hypothetical protein
MSRILPRTGGGCDGLTSGTRGLETVPIHPILNSVERDPMATLPTSEIRTALISWKGELLKLAVDFPEHFTASIVEARLDAMDAALLAIDGSTTVTLTPATCAI